jgi:hypothetical protein
VCLPSPVISWGACWQGGARDVRVLLNRDSRGVLGLYRVQFEEHSQGVEVSGDGTGVVSHAGIGLLRPATSCLRPLQLVFSTRTRTVPHQLSVSTTACT